MPETTGRNSGFGIRGSGLGNREQLTAMRNRREFIRDLALSAPAALAAFSAADVHALAGQTPSAPSARPNPNFPQVPTWNTELRELAPNVYAYVQAGGPGRDNVSISNAGLIVG